MKRFAFNCAIFISIVVVTIFILNRNYFPSKLSLSSNYDGAIVDKHDYANHIRSPRIIFCGGSNVAFGINSPEIAEATHLSVVNLGLLGGLGLDFILNEAKYTARPSDIVVLSPEYYLSPEGVYSYKKDIVRIFPPAAEYFTPTLSQIADDFFIEDLKNNLPNTISVIARLKNTAPKPSVYLRSSFNENGDVVKNFVPVPPLDFSANKGLTYGYYGGIKLLNNFKVFASRHHISVYFMYPCYPLSLYNGSNKAIEMMAADFKDDLKIKILDKPGDAVLPDSLFYNTEYHLNPHGRELRTQRIISLFKSNHIGVFQ
jgi:hypothetical protein